MLETPHYLCGKEGVSIRKELLMARIPRIMLIGEPTAYHIMSRTALDGYPIDDVDKDYFVERVAKLSKLYFVEVLGFCAMGNHFHLLVRMRPDANYSDEDLKRRLADFYDKEPIFYEDGQLPFYREKLSNLSEYVREIKVRFTRFYNRRHGRRGYFWGDRFKSVIVEKGETLINCLAYIDLNPVRAGLVTRPEDYRWNSIGYHIQTNNKNDFLSLDFGLRESSEMSDKERLRQDRRFLYETGAMEKEKGVQIESDVLEKERKNDFELTRARRFICRTRYFTDSGIIGGKAFVSATYRKVKEAFQAKRDKIPKPVAGLSGIYSLKRLAES
jgi:putative transposase